MENEDRTDNIVVMIEGEFANSQVKEIASGEMISRLKEKGYKYIDIDRALVSAERRKILRLQSRLYKWMDTK